MSDYLDREWHVVELDSATKPGLTLYDIHHSMKNARALRINRIEYARLLRTLLAFADEHGIEF
ncbi:hypothetical protein [Nocardia nova]|uniref:hypothetical protein n=1 Tax=Nocardia nova TaxID=37330 RepID=UPI0033F5631D